MKHNPLPLHSPHSQQPFARHPVLRRRTLLGCLAAAGWPAGVAAQSAGAPLPRLALLSFELVDDHPDEARKPVLDRRLAAMRTQMHQGLQALGLYEMVDTAPAQQALAQLAAQQEYLYRCNGCLADVGRLLDAPLVATGWVQRVSSLILNLNVVVREAATDREVLVKSVDMRGDNDESWNRALRFMLRDWAERRSRNPGYGR